MAEKKSVKGEVDSQAARAAYGYNSLQSNRKAVEGKRTVAKQGAGAVSSSRAVAKKSASESASVRKPATRTTATKTEAVSSSRGRSASVTKKPVSASASKSASVTTPVIEKPLFEKTSFSSETFSTPSSTTVEPSSFSLPTDSYAEGVQKKDKKKIIIPIIIIALLAGAGFIGTRQAINNGFDITAIFSKKDPAKQRANTLALVQKYLDKGQYDDAMKLLNELLQADINDEEAEALLDQAIEMKKLAESQKQNENGSSPNSYNINFDTDEITNALREQNEKNQETLNRLLAEQRQKEESASNQKDEAAIQQKAMEEQRKKEEAERKQKEEALAKKNKDLKGKIDNINNKVLAGKADLNTGNIDGALKNFEAAQKQLPLDEGEPEFSAAKYSEIASALYEASLSEKDPARKEKLNKAAVQYVNKALANNPDDPVSHYVMGMNYIDDGDWEKAQKELAAAVKNNPDNYSYYYNLGRAQYRLKNYAAARSSFESSVKYNKNFESGYFNLGMTCSRLKLNKDALAAFRNAHQVNPNYARAYLEEARILNNDFNDAKGALEAYKKVIELDPVNTHALNECGSVYAGMEDYAKAEDCYRRAVALLKPSDKDPITFYNLATALFNQKKYADADKNAQTAYSQMDALKNKSDKAMIVYNYALIEDTLNKADKAITLYKEVLTLDPDNTKTKTNLGKMFMAMDPPDPDSALKFSLEAYNVTKTFELENNLGSAYLMKKDYNNAITYFQNALKRSPKDYTVRFNLAQAYSGAGNFENAKTTYLELLKADANNWDAYIEVAKVFIALKDTANAEAYLKILQQKNPTYKKDQVDALLAATAL